MVTVPTGVWVIKTQNNRGDVDVEKDGALAYMCPSDSKGTKKMQETGRNWAGRRRWNSDKGAYEEYEGGQENVHGNEPQTGFKILKSVSRWSTSNKVWRVRDPRGFQVEIYTGNMEEVVQHAVIDHGVITTPCVWGRSGGNNVLLPTDTPEYKEAVANTKLQNLKVSTKDLEPGDRIKLKSNETVIYMGSAYPVRLEDRYEASFKYKIPKSKSHFFMSGGDSIHVDSKSKVDLAEILDKKFLDLGDDHVRFINEKVGCGEWTIGGTWSTGNTVFIISKRADIDTAQVRFSVNSMDTLVQTFNKSDYYHNNFLVASSKNNDDSWLYVPQNQFSRKEAFHLRIDGDRKWGRGSYRSGVLANEIKTLKMPRLHQAGTGVVTVSLSDLRYGDCHTHDNRSDNGRYWHHNTSFYKVPNAADWLYWVPTICIKDYEIRLFV